MINFIYAFIENMEKYFSCFYLYFHLYLLFTSSPFIW